MPRVHLAYERTCFHIFSRWRRELIKPEIHPSGGSIPTYDLYKYVPP